ncbi:MAG: leucine-rich repeat protein [Oscillospiraceae bacterium]|nr:leucine-rich repeat protein [Oscillospiraceae bacterium]
MKLKKLLAGLMALNCMFAFSSVMPCISEISANAEGTVLVDNTEYVYENFTYRRSKLATAVTGDEIVYVLRITGAVDGATDIIIPEEINGDKVTSIENGAFKDCESLVSLQIPDTVTIISSCAFQNCTNLKEIKLSEKIYTIPSQGFAGCTSLENIVIPENITSINTNAFQDCTSLENIKLPEKLKSLSSGIFKGCTNLKNINIPDSVETIESSAFENCINLENISFSQNVNKINLHAFENTAWLNSQPDGAVYINNFLYCYKGEMPEHTEFIIPDGIKHIVPFAFVKQKNLISVILPESLETIGTNAFGLCENLEQIHFSNNLTDVDETAFNSTAWLNQQENGIVYAGNYALLYKGEFPEQAEITLRDGITVMNPELFAGNTELVSITLPDGFKMLYDETFLDCANLANITIPDSLEIVGYHAFEGTAWFQNQPDGLIYVGNIAYQYKGEMPENTEIILKNGTVSVSPRAFSACSNLTSVILPNGIKNIGHGAFSSCNITSVTLPESITTIGEYYSKRKAVLALKSVNNFELTVLNPDCKFVDLYVFPKGKNTVIKGYENSTAQILAEKNNYNFESLGEAPEIIEKILLGDVTLDNTISIGDVVLATRAVLGKESLTDKQLKAVDFNQNNIPEAIEALKIMEYVVGLITQDDLANFQ